MDPGFHAQPGKLALSHTMLSKRYNSDILHEGLESWIAQLCVVLNRVPANIFELRKAKSELALCLAGDQPSSFEMGSTLS